MDVRVLVGVSDGLGTRVGVDVTVGKGWTPGDEDVDWGDESVWCTECVAMGPNCCEGMFGQGKRWSISLVAPSAVARQATNSQICTAVLVLMPRLWRVGFCVLKGASLEYSAI